MSRVAKNPVVVPSGVEVNVAAGGDQTKCCGEESDSRYGQLPAPGEWQATTTQPVRNH